MELLFNSSNLTAIILVALFIFLLLFLMIMKELINISNKTLQVIILLGGQPEKSAKKRSKLIHCSWCLESVPPSAITKSNGDKLCPACWRAKYREEINH